MQIIMGKSAEQDRLEMYLAVSRSVKEPHFGSFAGKTPPVMMQTRANGKSFPTVGEVSFRDQGRHIVMMVRTLNFFPGDPDMRCSVPVYRLFPNGRVKGIDGQWLTKETARSVFRFATEITRKVLAEDRFMSLGVERLLT